MYIFITILIIIVCVLIMLIVLVQNPKGSGLGSSFGGGGGNQVMGVQRTSDFLEKATWTLAISLLVFSLVSNFAIDRETVTTTESEIKGQVENANDFVPPAGTVPLDQLPGGGPDQPPVQSPPTDEPPINLDDQ